MRSDSAEEHRNSASATAKPAHDALERQAIDQFERTLGRFSLCFESLSRELAHNTAALRAGTSPSSSHALLFLGRQARAWLDPLRLALLRLRTRFAAIVPAILREFRQRRETK